MINEVQGNLLHAPVEALVNTVNTEGVMGKGLALEFKKTYPEMFRDYAAAAKRGELKLGAMHVWSTGLLDGPQLIINFPTKGHWRSKSRVADITIGLQDLTRLIHEYGITSIAIPPLGCGNGGLDWEIVRPRIYEAFRLLPDVDVRIYPPSFSPNAQPLPSKKRERTMTPHRAALVSLCNSYIRKSLHDISLIEIQKLVYFLQLSGEELNLQFEPNRYGPYADRLRHVLRDIEGEFLVGYGNESERAIDAKPLLSVLPNAVPLASRILENNIDTTDRIKRILELADGYESPYGLELLATVHWVATHNPNIRTDDDIASLVANWSPRKAQMFTKGHVNHALATLRNQHWLPARFTVS